MHSTLFLKKLGLVFKQKKKNIVKKNNCSETTLDKNKVCIKKIIRSERKCINTFFGQYTS